MPPTSEEGRGWRQAQGGHGNLDDTEEDTDEHVDANDGFEGTGTVTRRHAGRGASDGGFDEEVDAGATPGTGSDGESEIDPEVDDRDAADNMGVMVSENRHGNRSNRDALGYCGSEVEARRGSTDDHDSDSGSVASAGEHVGQEAPECDSPLNTGRRTSHDADDTMMTSGLATLRTEAEQV